MFHPTSRSTRFFKLILVPLEDREIRTPLYTPNQLITFHSASSIKQNELNRKCYFVTELISISQLVSFFSNFSASFTSFASTFRSEWVWTEIVFLQDHLCVPRQSTELILRLPIRVERETGKKFDNLQIEVLYNQFWNKEWIRKLGWDSTGSPL